MTTRRSLNVVASTAAGTGVHFLAPMAAVAGASLARTLAIIARCATSPEAALASAHGQPVRHGVRISSRVGCASSPRAPLLRRAISTDTFAELATAIRQERVAAASALRRASYEYRKSLRLPKPGQVSAQERAAHLDPDGQPRVDASLMTSGMAAFMELERSLAATKKPRGASDASSATGETVEAVPGAPPELNAVRDGDIDGAKAALARVAAPAQPDPAECCGNDCPNCVWVQFWEKEQAYERAVARVTAIAAGQ